MMDDLNAANMERSAESPPELKPGEAELAAAPVLEPEMPAGQACLPAVPAATAVAQTPPAPESPAPSVPDLAAAAAQTPPAEIASGQTAPGGQQQAAVQPEGQAGMSDLPAAEPPAIAETPAAKPLPPPVAEAPAVAEEEPKSDKLDWYILKVQSNREESIREGLLRRVAIAGLGRFFGDVIVPTEKVTEFKGGKKKVIKRKLYPGYLVVHMEINDDTWFLVRETPGIGDFTGAAGHPSPMLPHEVARIVSKQEEKSEKAPKLKISFRVGERVKINEGTFENFEGEVDSIDETNGRVTVMINIFGRSTPVELEYWQIEAL
jgi:transcription termination/antitermination protein NusG